MTLKQTQEYVKSLGYPFTDIYEFATDFILEHDDNENGWELMASIEDMFTEMTNEFLKEKK